MTVLTAVFALRVAHTALADFDSGCAAFDRGDADAQNNLGGMYAEGLGAAPDRVEAYMWFELAARAGHEMAGKNRAYLAKTMSAAQIVAAVARARAWRSARP